ncbi:MAG: T9SS type A sorting domain-containing protein [Bacteroidales bacterium]|nr:MAG: T9SS type A sorting domain-containing protein [Bacteroidales bacterium]
MKRRILLSIIFVFGIGALLAQNYSLTPTVISTAGHFSSAGGYSLSGTVGELAVKTLDPGGSYILTQGFQQPFALGVNPVIDPQGIDWSVNAYPNPVSEFLNIQFNIEKSTAFNIEIMDMTGKKLLIRNLPGITPEEIITVDLTNFVRGVYLLRITTPDQKVNKVYKIQKF